MRSLIVLAFAILLLGAGAAWAESVGPTFVELRFVADAGGQPLPTLEGKQLLLEPRPLLSTYAIADAKASEQNVDLILTPTASLALEDATKRNRGRRLAIVVNGIVRTAPAIAATISGGHIRVPAKSPAEAIEIVRRLTATSAPTTPPK